MCADLRPVALARYGQPDEGLNVTDVLASTTKTTKSQLFFGGLNGEIATASDGRHQTRWEYARGATSAMQHCGKPHVPPFMPFAARLESTQNPNLYRQPSPL